MEMESSSKVQEETDQKIDPDRSVKHDDAHDEPMKTEEKQNATRASALDTILKSLWKICVFRKELLSSFTEDEFVFELRHFILSNLSLTVSLLSLNLYNLSTWISLSSCSLLCLQEPNGVYDLLVTILELLPRWETGYEPLQSKFEVYETLKKMCNRCKVDTEYPLQLAYGPIVIANSVREFKSAFEDLTFENVLKVIRTTLMMPCDKEGCGKRNYVERVINTPLPSVFTIALEWENNETEEEISATTSVLATEIDISEICKYEGDSVFTKYRLVSMVCLCGDQYNCISYENGRWIRYFASKKEAIGDWNSVLTSFVKLKIRPEILFFENVKGQIMGTDEIGFGSLGKMF
ncbi:Ubiquitin carboxyl-terminal hydrolase family protein [Raphanus sativus]|nr:Ubiquitin carboxyl-terminal hydrolase family protein [Raphanus sativus]